MLSTAQISDSCFLCTGKYTSCCRHSLVTEVQQKLEIVIANETNSRVSWKQYQVMKSLIVIIIRAVYVQSFLIHRNSRSVLKHVARRSRLLNTESDHISSGLIHQSKTLENDDKILRDVPRQDDKVSMDRRSLFIQSMALAVSSWTFNSIPVSAGLVFFPCVKGLMNTYHLMRAGESLLETQDIFSTNALFLTNHEDVLSPRGIEQVQSQCKSMIEKDIIPSVVKYSLAAKAVETANIIASELKMGRNRLIPEYTFMDPRAVGKWDMLRISSIEDAVWAFDEQQAGKDGRGARPPPSEDSTPNETLFDQSIRLRQLMSALETQYSGDTILLIFPDGTSPALLSAMISGIPYNRVHELNFSPGEIRFNVTVDNVFNHLAASTSSSVYNSKVNKGKEYLQTLLLTDTEDIINVKEEQERAEIQRQKAISDAKQIQIPRRPSSTAAITLSDSERVPAYGALLATLLVGIGKALKKDDDNSLSIDSTLENVSPLSSSSSVVNTDNSNMTPRIVTGAESITPSIPFQNVISEKKEKSKEEKAKEAEDAMEKYMSQGDGSDEWLGSIAEIIRDK